MKVFWKEWRQQRWLLVFGCLAGIALPVFEIVDDIHSQRQEIQTDIGSGVVLGCGAFFAMLLALATTSGDVRGKLVDFWQSRPVSPVRLFGVKMGVGAMVLLVCFLFILSLDFITRYISYPATGQGLFNNKFDTFAWAAFCYTYPIALMLFAITMFYEAVLRDSAKAILLGIWTGLLVYFLPLLVSGLNWMNVFEQVDNNHRYSIVALLFSAFWRGWGGGEPLSFTIFLRDMGKIMDQLQLWPIFWSYVGFLIFMIGATIGFTVLSITAVRRRWHWQPGQKTIVWAIGLSGACIYGLSLFHLGNNLEYVTEREGRKIISEFNLYEPAPIKLNWTSVDIGEEVVIPEVFKSFTICVEGNIAYRIEDRCQATEIRGLYKHHLMLDIYPFPFEDKRYHRFCEVRFYSSETREANDHHIAGCTVYENRLYIAYQPYQNSQKSGIPFKKGELLAMPLRLLIADVKDPAQPIRISDEEIDSQVILGASMVREGSYLYVNDGKQFLILSLTQPERLEIVKRINKSEMGEETKLLLPYRNALAIKGKILYYEGSKMALFELSNPVDPKIIYQEKFYQTKKNLFQGGIWILTYQEGYLYIATIEGLSINKLILGTDGKLHREQIGYRQATPLERLAGRYPRKLLVYKGWLVENANNFGVLVYDVSDPARPRRAYHTNMNSFCRDIGIWNGLLWMVSYDILNFLDLPEKGPE